MRKSGDELWGQHVTARSWTRSCKGATRDKDVSEGFPRVSDQTLAAKKVSPSLRQP